MRVVRRLGSNTADVVGLGEDLQLRIEIDQDSAFGLFARNLEARTDNGELLNLIDQSGCPLNELIFPSLGLEGNTRALIADFKVRFTKIQDVYKHFLKCKKKQCSKLLCIHSCSLN